MALPLEVNAGISRLTASRSEGRRINTVCPVLSHWRLTTAPLLGLATRPLPPCGPWGGVEGDHHIIEWRDAVEPYTACPGASQGGLLTRSRRLLARVPALVLFGCAIALRAVPYFVDQT